MKKDYEIIVDSGEPVKKKITVNNISESESVMVRVTPLNSCEDICEYNITNNDALGNFEYHTFQCQEDMLAFIKGITTTDGDNVGSTYMMKLDMDIINGKIVYTLHTTALANRKENYGV